MPAEPAGAVDATTESDAEPKATEQSKPDEQRSSQFTADLLRAAQEDGHSIGFEAPKAETEDEPNPDDEQPEPEAEPAEEPTETEEPAEPEPTAPEGAEPASIDEQIAAYKAKSEKPPWYLVRISEETAKRKERTERAERAEARAQEAESRAKELESQLAGATAPPPTEANPFSDVYDPTQLSKLESQYERILEFAEKNRDGAEDVLVGRNKDGSDIRKDLTPEEIADMRYKADRALRKDIPQRRGYLDARAKADAQALEIYPDLKDGTSDMTKEAISILRANRNLETVLGPEALIWIGHAIAGRNLYLKRNGKTDGTAAVRTDAATRIAASAKAKIAPTPTKARAPIERARGADLAAANRKLEERGDADSAEEVVGLLLSKRGSTAKKLEPIGQ